MTTSVRLDKRVAEVLRCSRGDAQQYIENGWVLVDGRVMELPHAMVAEQAIELAADARLDAVEPATMLFNKSPSVAWQSVSALVTADGRSAVDATDTRVLQRHFDHLGAHVPLDDEASGLVVATQDPRIRRRLVEDVATIEQEYIVEVTGTLPPYGLAVMARGMVLDGRALPPCKVSWQNEFRLRFAIKDVRPGQLRQMCAQVGLTVMASKRIRIGRVSMGKLPVGEWRYLPAGDRF